MEFERPSLVFPQAVSDLQDSRKGIRGELRDTYNRLHSIKEDADFVHEAVSPAYPDFPVIANQRAGSWYVRPGKEKAHAYFKSTDGHANEHNFNLRRANLVLLPLIKEREGIIFVDSTRRGKRFPDALSKTIPLWCAVLNRARINLLPPSPDNSNVSLEDWEAEGKLFTAPQSVGRSEHSQIEVKIDGWAEDLANSAYDLSPLLSLTRPLRPFFISPSSTLPSPQPSASFTSYYPVILCSASKLLSSTSDDGSLERARGFTYVQGSGDDHEAWSRGLTAALFWKNEQEILKASREEIDEVIATILMEQLSVGDGAAGSGKAGEETSLFTPIRSTNISLAFAVDSASLPSPTSASSPLVVFSASSSPSPPTAPSSDSVSPTHLSVKPGKAGYASFFSPSPSSPLNGVLETATKRLREGKEVRIAVLKNDEGKQGESNDLGVAVALILLVRLFDSDGGLLPADASSPLANKDLIRNRLQWLLEAFPTVNPSRASLNKVNEALMSKGR